MSLLTHLLRDFGARLFGRGAAPPARPAAEPAQAAFEAFQRGDYAVTQALCHGILETRPGHFDALHLLGVVELNTGRYAQAAGCLARAVAANPGHAEGHKNLGTALANLQRHEEAAASYGHAIALDASSAESHFNRGAVLHLLKRHAEEAQSYERAIALRPDYAEAHYNLGLCLLLKGDLARGWQEFEWRWKIASLRGNWRGFAQPLWLGDAPLAGKTILLHGEQGMGDSLQFCRYAGKVRDLGARVILEVPAPLVALLGTLDGVAQVVASASPLPAFDFHCPMMSLPLAFGTVLESIPAQQRYVHSDAGKVAQWRNRLGERTRPRVGLVWSGGFRPDQPHVREVSLRRNVGLRALAPLRNAGIEFYSLQKGRLAESELFEAVKQGWDGPEIVDLTADIGDFSDTAALIENLDLVITVDTSTAHLAAALGKPVWLLNRFDTCWRWLLDRDDSPWYPTLRQFRQTRPGEWDEPVARVGEALRRLS